MKKFIENKWLIISYGFLLVIVGVLTLVYAIIQPEIVTTVLSIAIAVSLFVIGVANIAVALIAHTSEFFTKTLLVGSGAIAAGVILCIDRTLIGQFIAYLLGVFCLAFAVVALIKFILFIVYKQKVAWIVLYAVVFLASAAAGILILLFRDQTTQVLYGMIGSIIILAGLFEIFANLKSLIKHTKEEAKEEGKKEQQQVVEQQTVEVNEEEVQSEEPSKEE